MTSKTSLKQSTVIIGCVIAFGAIIVGISFTLASFLLHDKSLEAVNLFVTAILGSAVTMVALGELKFKNMD